MNTTNQEANVQSDTLTNVSETLKQDSNLVDITEIEGTPFKMVKDGQGKKDKWFIVMGDHRLTEPTDTEEEQIDKLLTEHWRIVVNVIAIVVEKFGEFKEAERMRTAGL